MLLRIHSLTCITLFMKTWWETIARTEGNSDCYVRNERATKAARSPTNSCTVYRSSFARWFGNSNRFKVR